MSYNINNIDDLRAKIAILKQDKLEQELYFDQKITAITKAVTNPFGFITNIFKSSSGTSPFNNSHASDIVTSLSKAFLPIILNKTIFNGKGIFIKTLVTILSQKTVSAKFFNRDTFSYLIDNITQLISSRTKPKEKRDYGIPEDSETY